MVRNKRNKLQQSHFRYTLLFSLHISYLHLHVSTQLLNVDQREFAKGNPSDSSIVGITLQDLGLAEDVATLFSTVRSAWMLVVIDETCFLSTDTT